MKQCVWKFMLVLCLACTISCALSVKTVYASEMQEEETVVDADVITEQNVDAQETDAEGQDDAAAEETENLLDEEDSVETTSNDNVDEYVTGFVTEDGYTYYYDDNGELHVGWLTVDGNKYYFNTEGVMQTGWQSISGEKYYFDLSTGIMKADGWLTIDGKKYYFNPSGRLHYGWRTIDGEKYYCDPSTGVMQTGWVTISGKKYYFNPSGRLHYGWRTIDGEKYYCNPSTGVMQTGWVTISGKKYYFNPSGRLHYGWRTIDGEKYYCNTSTGVMQTGWVTISGKKYYFNPSGRLHYGGRTIDGKKYYCDTSTGVMYTGWKVIGSYSYYFNSSGVLQTGGVVGSKSEGYAYVDSNGRMTSKIDSATTAMMNKAQSYSSSTKYLILVNSSTNRVGIFYGSKGNWVLKYYWTCTTGKSSTPTKKGSFTVGSKGKSFSGSTYTCWYYTQFSGNYLFHSVLYKKGSMSTITDGRLGYNLSHGCVRLSISNAKWIYDNIPKNTKVISY